MGGPTRISRMEILPPIPPFERARRDTQTNTLLAALAAKGLLPGRRETLSRDVAYGRYTWNVSKAQEIVRARPHRLLTISRHQLDLLTRTATVDRTHVAAVDPAQLGIIGLFVDVQAPGWRWVIIDGNHRAVAALQTGAVFQCYQLTPIESWALMLEHPCPGESVFYAEYLLRDKDCMILTQ
jgi:hypothetical protein